MDYIKDPEEIYRRSFATIEAEVDVTGLPDDLRPLAVRLMHACGMTDLLDDLDWYGDPVASGRAALMAGAPILCDCRMAADGVITALLPRNNAVQTFIAHKDVPALAGKLGTTRSAAAVELWHEQIAGALVVIGNAPTALFHLLERIDAGWPKPAVILAFPVGFVGAAESKAALSARRDLSFVTLQGRRGGSAMAAAALNAIAKGTS